MCVLDEVKIGWLIKQFFYGSNCEMLLDSRMF